MYLLIYLFEFNFVEFVFNKLKIVFKMEEMWLLVEGNFYVVVYSVLD